jgi:hypothetical protein
MYLIFLTNVTPLVHIIHTDIITSVILDEGQKSQNQNAMEVGVDFFYTSKTRKTSATEAK